jgi:NADH:ubiquinone oxidoreductase subunit E/NAD-dependent dihydropyrimidine dehydrogenase PreA subunit
MKNDGKIGAALVVGGGIGGIQAALDLADSGFKVYLMEKGPSIGGVMAKLDKTFPTNDCSMCILAPKLVSVARHPNIKIVTNASIESVSGEAGNFLVTVKKEPRYVDTEKCTGCGVCMQNCPVRQIASLDGRPEEIRLAENDLRKITEIVKDYRSKKGSLMPVLQRINSTYNYLPISLLKYISRELNISLSLIYNIATFYKTFSLEERGQHIVKVCLGTACHVRGADGVLEEFKRILGIEAGQNTKDLIFTLETVNCVGACALGPVIMVDNEYFGNMSPPKVRRIIDKFYKKKE